MGSLIADLGRPRLDAVTEAALRERLRTASWCWPPSESRALCERAAEIAQGDAPALGSGTALLVAVDPHDSSASLWALEIGCASKISDADLSSDAVDAWTDAATALPRSLPFLWRPVQTAYAATRCIRHLGTLCFTRQIGVRPRELCGRSFGLSFVLAMASHILGQPLPDDVAASAAVDADGRSGPVDGLPQKIAAVEAYAPRVRRFFVHASQVTEAEAATDRLRIIPVSSAAQAVDDLLGEALRSFVVRVGDEPEQRAEMVESFFRLTMLGRGAAIDWSPVERGARAALQSWRDLDSSDRWKLGVAEAVAARHERNHGEFPLPDPSTLGRLARPLRLAVVTHLVQQGADTGTPPASVARQYAHSEIVPIEECFLPQLKLLGALARLDAVNGQPERALALQEQIALALLDRLEYSEVSYQLSEWYRLAGALSDHAAFARATDVHRRVDRLGGLGFTGSPYCRLARARAQVCLELTEGADPEASLRQLAGDTRIPRQVRWSAVRWLARLLALGGRDEEKEAVLAPLRAAAACSEHAAEVRLALVQLDQGGRVGDSAVCQAAVEALRKLEPGPVVQLIHSARREMGEHLSALYPY